MKKLVLGIVAVILVQIGFLVYTASKRPVDTSTSVARTNIRPTAQAERIPEVPVITSSAPPQPEPDTKPANVAGAKEPSRSTRVVETTRKAREQDPPRQSYPTRSVAKADIRSKPHRDPPLRRTVSPAIPRGYTMALVEYAPLKSEIRTKEVRPTKKRSFIEKAFPALVKKPWKWMKSLASKFD